jgi:hypothetical protein
MEDMVVAIFAGTQGYLDRIKTDRVVEFQETLRVHMHAEHDELLRRVRDTGALTDEDENELQKAIGQLLEDFGPDFDEEGQPLEEAPAATTAPRRGPRDQLDQAVEEARSAEADAEREIEPEEERVEA